MGGLARLSIKPDWKWTGFLCLERTLVDQPVLADRKAFCPGQAKPGAAGFAGKGSLENASPIARLPPRQAAPGPAHRHC